jgi:hypothetical protein
MGEQLTKEEYQERISKLDLGDRNVIAQLEKEFEALKAKAPISSIPIKIPSRGNIFLPLFSLVDVRGSKLFNGSRKDFRRRMRRICMCAITLCHKD